MNDIDQSLRNQIAAEAEHAEATPDADLTYRRRRPVRSSVYGLRLPDERIEQLRRLAQARGVEPSALVRQWVIELLDAAECNQDHETDRWERELRDASEHLRRLLDERPHQQAI